MVTCVISSCKNTSVNKNKYKNGITFHRFPRDKDRKRQWEVAVNKKKSWTSTCFSVICSEHFSVKDFYLTQSGLRRLRDSAVPSINISACQQPEATICTTQPIDIRATDSPEVIELKHKVHRLETIAENRKRRLNLMWQSRRKMLKKLECMRTMVKHLVKVKRTKEGF